MSFLIKTWFIFHFSYTYTRKYAIETQHSNMFLCCSEARKNKRVMKVPKGTSDYQATWIVDDDEEEENAEMDEQCSDEDDDKMLDEAMDGEDEENSSQVPI